MSNNPRRSQCLTALRRSPRLKRRLLMHLRGIREPVAGSLQHGGGRSNVAAADVQTPVFNSVACSHHRCGMLETAMLDFQRWQRSKTFLAPRRSVDWHQPGDRLRYLVQKPLCPITEG
jgi:hypothetical protein